MPPIVARNIFRLKLSDFVIDPFKVQTSDIKEGIYRAKVAFSGREVLLQILPSSYPQEECVGQPDYINSFQDHGLACVLWEPTLTLWDMIKTHIRVGQPLANTFVWKVAQDVSSHIAARSLATDWQLSPTRIKISQSNGAIHVNGRAKFEPSLLDDPASSLPSPPELQNLLYKFSPEKTYIWSLGCLLLDMVTVTPAQNNLREHGKRKHNIPRSQPHILEDKLNALKTYPDSVLQSVIERCLNNDPSRRPQGKEVLRIAREQINQSS